MVKVATEYADHLYSVGGHLHFGETSEEAVVREVEEEVGRRLKPARLGFVHESYYHGKSPSKMGKEVYGISLYYYMDVPEDFEPASSEFHEGENKEYLMWVDPDDPRPVFPEFFRTGLRGLWCSFSSDYHAFFTTILQHMRSASRPAGNPVRCEALSAAKILQISTK